MDLNSEAEVERALKLDKDYMGKSAGLFLDKKYCCIGSFKWRIASPHAFLSPSVQRHHQIISSV